MGFAPTGKRRLFTAHANNRHVLAERMAERVARDGRPLGWPMRPRRVADLIQLLQIDGLVVAALVELGAPYFVRALVLGWTEVNGRPEAHVEITYGF